MERIKTEYDNSLLHEVEDYIAGGCEGEVDDKVVNYHDALYKLHGLALREGESCARKYARKMYGVSMFRSKQMMYESDQLFYTEADINKKVARNKIIDKLTRAAEVVLAVARTPKDFDTYRAYMVDIAKLQGLDQPDDVQLPDSLFQERIVIHSLDPAKIGLPRMDANEIARIIDDMPVPQKEKRRLSQEAQVKDIDFTQILNDISEKTQDR